MPRKKLNYREKSLIGHEYAITRRDWKLNGYSCYTYYLMHEMYMVTDMEDYNYSNSPIADLRQFKFFNKHPGVKFFKRGQT